MGFRKHTTLKCHYCKSRKALGGTKKMGKLDDKTWQMVKVDKVGYVWLCPSCNRKRT